MLLGRGKAALLGAVGLSLIGCGGRSGLLAGSDAATATPHVDAAVDAAEEAAGDDAAGDASFDAGADAGDASIDAGADAGDASIDAGDASIDAGDASIDAGDASIDAGADAVADAQPDAPTIACGDGGESTAWLWNTRADSRLVVNAMALAPDDSLVVAGYFDGSVDFDPASPLVQATADGVSDAFIAKLDCAGRLLWARTWGGPSIWSGWGDEAEDVAVGADGSILVAGQYCTTVDFDPGVGTDERTSLGCFDGYVSRFTAEGDHVWTRTFGGPGRDRVSGVRALADGTIGIVGQFEDTVDFDPGPGDAQRTSNGEIDVFAAALTADGELIWVDVWGGRSTEYGPVRLATDSAGALFVTGEFQVQVDFDPGPATDVRTASGGDDVYVVKLEPDGKLQWVDTISGTASVQATGIATSAAGDVAVAGYFYGPTDFDPSSGTDLRNNLGLYDAFVTQLDNAGREVWTRTWGKSGSSGGLDVVTAEAVTFAPNDEIIVAGAFQGSIDLDPETTTDVRLSNGQYDGYASAFGPDGVRHWTWTFGSNGFDFGSALVAMPSGGAAVGGSFSGTVSFDLGSRQVSATAAVNASDAFTARLDPQTSQ